jgi:hypothetical protein
MFQGLRGDRNGDNPFMVEATGGMSGTNSALHVQGHGFGPVTYLLTDSILETTRRNRLVDEAEAYLLFGCPLEIVNCIKGGCRRCSSAFVLTSKIIYRAALAQRAPSCRDRLGAIIRQRPRLNCADVLTKKNTSCANSAHHSRAAAWSFSVPPMSSCRPSWFFTMRAVPKEAMIWPRALLKWLRSET